MSCGYLGGSIASVGIDLGLNSATDGQILIARGSGNSEWLTPAYDSAVGTTNNPTKTGTAFAIIPEMTVTITSNGLPALLIFTCTFVLDDDDEYDIALFQDGVEIPSTRKTLEFHASSGVLGLTPGSIDGATSCLATIVTGLTDGVSYTFTVQWSAVVGTAGAREAQRKFEVKEIP